MPWVAAAAAIGSWMSSEQGRRASKEEREKMQRMLNDLQDPNFDAENIDYPTFEVLQRYVPQVSEMVQEVAPKFVELSAEAKEGRGAQLEVLRKLKEVGSQEGDILQDTAINQANREAAISNRGMQESIMENMRRRGASGSGMEMAAQLSAQQGAAERGAMGSQNAATEGYRSRLAALMQSGDLGGKLKNEETSLAEKNVGILNAFNERNATNRNAFNRNRDAITNDAQRYNIGEGQRINEKNLGGRYDAARANQQNYNSLAQKKFDNDFSKVTGQQAQSAINQQAITNNTQDRNNAIAGAAGGYAKYQESEDEKEQRRLDREAGMRTS